MRARQIKLRDLNDTLRRRLANRLADGLDEGKTLDQITDSIKQEFNFARSRAATIARTEVGAAVEEARHEGRKQAGVPLKSWLHSRKETGRPSHAATEAETLASPIASDDDFIIAGTTISCPHPRATGDPAHDINCGCTTISRYPGDGVKQLLARYEARGFLTFEQLAERTLSQSQGKEADDAPHIHNN